MMNKLLLSGLIALAFAACKKDPPPLPPDPGPSPHLVKACFTPSKTFIDSGETVTFENCSENDKSWQWNLLDGEVWNEKDAPAQTFNLKPGNYPISLIVYSADGVFSDDTTIHIAVARRSFTKIVIDRFPMVTSTGTVWDTDGSNPDITIRFGPKNDMKYYYGPFTNATFPLTIDIDPIAIGDDNNGEWSFRLADDDDGTPQPMTTFNEFVTKPGASPIELVNIPKYEAHAFYDRVKP